MTGKYNIREEVAQRFYRLPKVFFTSERYKKLSNDAKIAFAILQDRLDLSIKNQWFDEEGNIFFLYGNQQLGDILNCSKPTVIKIKKELNQAELLEERRMGLSQSNRLYLLKPTADMADIEQLKKLDDAPQSLGREEKSKNLTSRSKDSLPQEVKDFNTNDTELNDTDFSDTEYKINQLRDTQVLPEAILDALMKNKKRLMDDAIDLKDIVNHYFAHQEVLSVHQYADALQYSLERTPGKIHSITARLTKAVEDKRRWLSDQSKPVIPKDRTENVPEWLRKDVHELKVTNDISEEEIEQERQKLYRELGIEGSQ
ncbi:replication initiator protein A [Chryseomicrobium imtechense]